MYGHGNCGFTKAHKLFVLLKVNKEIFFETGKVFSSHQKLKINRVLVALFLQPCKKEIQDIFYLNVIIGHNLVTAVQNMCMGNI